MNTPQIPDDDFERELADLSKDYRAASTPHVGPPPAIDDAIRAAARRQVRAGPRADGWRALPAWTRPLTAAAVVVLTVSVIFVAVDNDPSLKPTPVGPLETRILADRAPAASQAPVINLSKERAAPAAAGAMSAPEASAPVIAAVVQEAKPTKQDAARTNVADSARAKDAPASLDAGTVTREADVERRQRSAFVPAPEVQIATAPPAPKLAQAAPAAPPVYAPPAAAAPQPFPATAASADSRVAVGALEKKEKIAAAPAAQSVPVPTSPARAVADAVSPAQRADKLAEAVGNKAAALAPVAPAAAPAPAVAGASVAKPAEPSIPSPAPALAARAVAPPATNAAPAPASRPESASLGVRGIASGNVESALKKSATTPEAAFMRLREHVRAMRWKEFDEELAAFEKAWPGHELPADLKAAKAARKAL